MRTEFTVWIAGNKQLAALFACFVAAGLAECVAAIGRLEDSIAVSAFLVHCGHYTMGKENMANENLRLKRAA